MKILIRLPNWLGDVVMSTAFIGAVKQLYPDARIDVIIKKELAGIGNLIPGLHSIHTFSKKEYHGLSGVYRFGKTLYSEKYDLFFNLPSSLSSLVMGWATGSKKRVGFKKEGGFFLLTNACKKPINVHRVDEYISLLEQFVGRPLNTRLVQLSLDAPLRSNKKILINFNSEASSRRMPLLKGKELINLLTAEFPGVIFTFIGSPKEQAFIDEICEGVQNRDRIENSVGSTNLIELCKLMAGAMALLTTDSGPAHLANSLGTPAIVLFGAGNEQNTAPYNKTNLTVLRYGKLSCEPCVRNTCKLYGIPKCLELIENRNIISSLKLLL